MTTEAKMLFCSMGDWSLSEVPFNTKILKEEQSTDRAERNSQEELRGGCPRKGEAKEHSLTPWCFTLWK